MPTKTLNIGLVGYGFMGRAHSNAYHKVNHFFDLEYQPVLQAVCGRNQTAAEDFAARWGWRSVETDWRKLIERPDIDAIDISGPNDLHHDIAIAAAQAGKMILCEKPLARDAQEATAMVAAVEEAGVPNFVWFNYRRVPAVALARQIVAEGRLGRIFHYRGVYLQDWVINPELPQGGMTLWRLDKASAGSGVLGDLLAHAFDLALWLNGPIESLSAAMETFVKTRKHIDTGKPMPVDVDDACAVIARFANGALGTFESSRYARGRKNQNAFEINGEHGSLAFDLEDPHRLQFLDHTDPAHLQGWRNIHVSASEHPYCANWWPPGTTLGYEHTFINALADFLQGLQRGESVQPDFRSALKVQIVCDAVAQAAVEQRWVNVPS
ncbi:MAG: Gfo/Idh/MocA family oxidoreductase [Candidatus Competibacteraceae bacterium]|nr:Gfo/Idh/MocA family oxidoreductase [Candidatus Competibacteraceae bacterium]MCB1813435.1 Gfo/Idh/MocA family oxidoreductase [Candidatus Competibacteraceae bacterium]